MDGADLAYLRTADGTAAVAAADRLALTDGTLLADVGTVRGIAGVHAAAVIEQVRARRRAAAKLGDVDGWLLTDEAVQQATPAAVAEQLRHQELTVGRIHAYAKPVVAALPGAAAGAGLGFALAADLRIGTPRTVVATAFASIALSGDFGVAWLLERLVGPAVARELMFLNPRLDGQACRDLGLLNRLLPAS